MEISLKVQIKKALKNTVSIYTPVERIDFIINSVQYILKKNSILNLMTAQ